MMKKNNSGKNSIAMALKMLMVVICVLVSAIKADYPIMSQHYAADPTAVEWNGRLYVYCSNDQENNDTDYTMDSIVCFSTDDLKNWTDHGVVFDADNLSSWYSGTAWAPCIVVKDNKFYLYFGDPYWGVGVVTSTSPTGPFTAPKNALVVSRASTVGADSTWDFDPGVFVDDDGQPYMYFGGGGANQMRWIKLNANMYDTVGAASTVALPDFFEASHLHKYNGLYYLSYADNYDSDYTVPTPTAGSQIAYMTSASPTSGFTYQGVALGTPPSNFGNNNHHTFFTFQSQWYCIYHNRYQASLDGVAVGTHRNICLDKLSYNTDGTIQQVSPTQDGLTQLKNLKPFVRVESETIAQQSGVKTEACSAGGMNVTAISSGDWIRVRKVDFSTGTGSFIARVASANSGGSIELRLDSLTGTLVGTLAVPNTGARQTWVTTTCSVAGATGVHDLYFKFVGGSGEDLFNFDWWQFGTALTATVNHSIIYQTIEGLGGAICFYNGWFTAHPNKKEIFDYAFSGLNLSMLRLGNWWRGTNGADGASYEIVNAMKARIGDRPILMTSWSPPAYLKSNGEVANGGTLITKTDGTFDYSGFADYWYNSLQDYASRGIVPTWIGIQNEPDWTADYDSCRFEPSEGNLSGVPTAGFDKAQDAVYNRLKASMTNPPKLLGPECVGLYGTASKLKDYMNKMNANTFYGIAHHLYGGSTDGTPDGYNTPFASINSTANTLFPGKPKFMTEFGDIKGLIPCANLIHNSLVTEQVSGYNHWCLIWPGDIGLVEIENPWGSSTWKNPKGYWLNESYWSMKHYSYYIQPGFRRVQASSSSSSVLMSAWLSPDDKRMVVVFINRNTTASAVASMNTGSFVYDSSSIYQTVGDSHFASLGSVSGSKVILPAASLTTIVYDHLGPVAPTRLAATAIAGGQVNLSWNGSANSLSYNIKRATVNGGPYTTIATGITTKSFCDVNTVAGSAYYYVVSANTAEGQSADSSQAAVVNMRAYLKFNETTGTTAADASGNGRVGTLVNGPIWNTSGKFGNAVEIDGTNDHITLPAGVVNGLTRCTISTWVYLDTISNWSRVFDFGTGTSVNMFLTPRHSSTTGTVRFAITTGGSGGEQRITGTSALPTGIWTHVAVTLNGSTGVLYVNGEEVGRNTAMTLTPNSLGNTTQNYIGKSQYSDPYIDGRIDEFRIYTTDLSAGEVSSLYAEQIPLVVLAPTEFTATGASNTRINLSWTASAGTVNYNIKRSTNSSGPFELLASVSGTSYADTNLAELMTYYYTINAVNNVGQSNSVGPVSAATLNLPPAVPTGLAAIVGDGQVSLSWNANSENDLAGYNVFRAEDPAGPYQQINSSLLTQAAFTDTGVVNYRTYSYKVGAVDNSGSQGNLTDALSATPTDGRLIDLCVLNFENGFGDWVNLSDIDNKNWLRNSGSTLTPTTGPETGAKGSSWYAYLETSPGGAYSAGDTAILESPQISGYRRSLNFYYHMCGSNTGSLNVDVYDGLWHYGVWTLSGQQHATESTPYSKAVVDLAGFTGPIKIRFRAIAAGGSQGDIAIDEIVVTGGALYGDADGNRVLDMTDLADFASYWLMEDCDNDLNGDCLVNFIEFTEFSRNWPGE